MVLTTLIMGFVIFQIWRRRTIWAVPLYAVLLAFDVALFSASATKIPDGAWLPLVIAAVLMLLFTTWARGRTLLAERLARDAMPVEASCAPRQISNAFRGLRSISRATRRACPPPCCIA